jgi:hypothetical protein
MFIWLWQLTEQFLMLPNIIKIHKLLIRIQEPVTCYHYQCSELVTQILPVSSEWLRSTFIPNLFLQYME